MEELIQQGMVYLAGLAASLIVGLLVQGLRKVNLSLSADRQAQLEYVVRQEVLRVEELAAAYLKERGAKLGSKDKLRRVLTAVTDRLPRVDHNEAETIVHAVLPQLGLGASTYLREVGKALRTPEPAQ